MHSRRRSNTGFTLLELAVVLVIVGLVTGMAMNSGVAVISASRLIATQQKMKTIDDILLQYRIANDRLPCPGDLTLPPGNANYGLEAGVGSGSAITAGTGVCAGTGMAPAANFTASGVTNSFVTMAEGALPAATLGVSSDLMYDGWGNRFRYAVDTNMTATGAFSQTPLGCNVGPITINDALGNARSTGATYAIISHGADGHGAYTKNGVIVNAGITNANTKINCHCDNTGATTTSSGVQTLNPATYVQMDASIDPTNALNGFDDIVSYKERWQMPVAKDKAAACPFAYVVDQGSNRIYKMLNGVFVRQFGCSGTAVCSQSSAAGQFSGPSSVAVDSSGNIWVGEYWNNRLQKLDSNGNSLLQVNSVGFPQGIAIDGSGHIWVTEYYYNRVQEFDSSGNSLLTFGSQGTGVGQFEYPYGVAIDPSGNYVWVADQTNNNVQEFDMNGNWQKQIGSCPSGACSSSLAMGAPNGIAFDALGNMWVSVLNGTQNNRAIEEFNSVGTEIAQAPCPVGSACPESSANGSFSVPRGVAFDSNGAMWTIDENYHRLQKFIGTTYVTGYIHPVTTDQTSTFSDPLAITFR